MFGAIVIAVANGVVVAKAESEAFEAFEARIKLLPPEEAQKERDKRDARIAAERAHRQAMELAEASRPRNWIETFFGK